MAMSFPPLPDWEQVSTNIVRVMGGNPSKFTLQGSNTYLLGNSPSRLLIDTAQGLPFWRDTLSTVLSAQSATVSTALLTHWHHDHIGGVKDLQAICKGVVLRKNTPSLDPDGFLDPNEVQNITDGEVFSTSGGDGRGGTGRFEIKAMHTPGHAKDHIAFLVTQSPDPSEVGSIFTADNVLGHGTAVFEDLAAYLASLERMRAAVAEISTRDASGGRKAYPGHGVVIEDAVAKIDEYVAHRRMREDEALNVLRYGATKRPGNGAYHDSITREGDGTSDDEAGGKEIVAGKEWGSMEMVRIIYRHYPENLHQPAEMGLLQVLEKLRGDGRVTKTEEGKWRVSERGML